jgi:hypothetical protein
MNGQQTAFTNLHRSEYYSILLLEVGEEREREREREEWQSNTGEIKREQGGLVAIGNNGR